MKYCADKFVSRLKELRTERNLSQRGLGMKLGVANTTVNDWEGGRIYPTIPNVFALAYFFGVTSDYLIGLKDE